MKARIADEKAAHPEFAGQSAAVVTPYEGLFIYGPEDPRSRMLVDLGFELPPIITDADDSEFGISLSSERTSDLGRRRRRRLARPRPPTSRSRRSSTGTTAYDEGRWVDITDADGDYYVGHSFVTPLSIPWVLDRYVPQLAAAADGDAGTEVPAPEPTDEPGVRPFDRGGRGRDDDRQPGRGRGAQSAARPNSRPAAPVITSAGVPWAATRRPSSPRCGRCSGRRG